jgi:hypothetical protein
LADCYHAAHTEGDAGKSGANPHDVLVLLTADHNEIDKLTREFERPARLRTAAKECAVEIETSPAISCARMQERMNLGGIR